MKNGSNVLKCANPNCKNKVLVGTERHDGSDPDYPRGHALDADGNVYHYGCMQSMVREFMAHPLKHKPEVVT